MYDVLDVSHYIINYSNKKGYFINNNKLQKLLYLTQALFLVNEQELCFKDDILVWETGPAIKRSYEEFKKFGNNHIPEIHNFYGYTDEKFTPNDKEYYEVLEYKTEMSIAHRLAIQELVDRLSQYSSETLVEVTKRQDPYLNVSYTKIISPTDIYKYFIQEQKQEDTPRPT